METEKENKQLKNSVFVDLFHEDESAEENDIALYNALHDVPLPPGSKITRMRIENILYMHFQNDISFGVNGKLIVLCEHQSTINWNMPLRSLMYIGRVFEQLIPARARYQKKRLPLPKPEFYTLYNGTDKWVKEDILKLSDAYIIKDGDYMLDLSVKVININPDEHHEVLDRCQVLKEYGEFVDTVREYQAKEVPDAYKYAIEDCIQRGILADYLAKKGSEVRNMLIAEYDYEMDIEVQREEAFADGFSDGLTNGKIQGTISTYRQLNFSREDTCHNLMKTFSLTSEQAQEYIEKYWDS